MDVEKTEFMNHKSIKGSKWIFLMTGAAVITGVTLFLSACSSHSGAKTEMTHEATVAPTATTVRVVETQFPTQTPSESSEEENLTFESVAELMDFLADDDPFIGPEDAPVVIVEFSDYACPFCGKFYLDTLPLILEAYPDEVKYVHRDYPIFGDVSFHLSESVDCALEQDKFWEMHEVYLALFSDFDPESMGHGKPQEPGGHDDRFDAYTDEKILELAETAGLELDSFSACLEERRYEDEVYYDYEIGAQIGIQAVPFFIINRQVVNGAQSFEVFQQVIEQSLMTGG